MKYALFEFVTEKACEIGETRWITRENPEDFDNKSWDTDREVMVAWPTEFTKVSKKIIKGSIDPSTVTTTTCVARVLKFSDDYESIRQHMKTYIDTGSTTTPSHGRGQRTSKKTSRYEELEEEPEAEVAKTPKRQRRQYNESMSSTAIDALKVKYNLNNEKIDCAKQSQSVEIFEDNIPWEDDDEELAEVAELKKKNSDLQQEMKKKDKEIAHLHSIIKNLKEIPSLPDIVRDLQKQVEKLKDGRSSNSSSITSSPSLPRSRSPSLKESTDSDTESDLVSFGPNISITKGQYKVIRSKGELKDYVYSVMRMVWNREVLCTHSMTGKVSNAFKEKDAKPQLDKEKVQSICEYGAKRFGCKPDDVRKVMISRVNNINKVEKAKEKASQK